MKVQKHKKSLKQLADGTRPLCSHERLNSRFFHPLSTYLHCMCKHPICTNLWTQHGGSIMSVHNEDIFAALLLSTFTQGCENVKLRFGTDSKPVNRLSCYRPNENTAQPR
jgi:hypothetical protein